MDSITQITLGAAVGELVLGRKVGNRAMMWGAIGGTIPDLDVMANFFLDPVHALAVHRGITHSIFFSVFAAFPFAWIVHRLYRSETHRKRTYKWFVFLVNLIILALISGGLGYMSILTGTGTGVGLGVVIFVLGLYFIYRLYRFYFMGRGEIESGNYWQWYLLFFLAFFTHIWLDCHTSYGTQVFQPFSNFRAAFDNISVADPAYTLPFLICVAIAAFLRRENQWRRRLTWMGILLSSLYMAWTISNKIKVDRFFARVLEDEQIDAIRFRTSPSILNNFLWSCVAETDSVYHFGQHSLLDKGSTIPVLYEIPKHHDRLEPYADDEGIRILQWFSNGYYTVWEQDDGSYILSDLRYGSMTDDVSGFSDFVFNFRVSPVDNGLEITEMRERPRDVGPMFEKLIKRIRGVEADTLVHVRIGD